MVRFAVPAFLALTAAACRTGARDRHWASCTCDYVTDFDQPGHVALDVCSEETNPVSAAERCARGEGVGAVTTCRCNASPNPCEPGADCRTEGAGR